MTKDHILLAADVRLALRRSITHPFVRKQELTVYTLNNELENLLTNVVNQAQQAGKVMLDSVPVDPNMLNQFQSTMPQVKEQMKAAGKDPVLLVPFFKNMMHRNYQYLYGGVEQHLLGK
mgnify:CR=1 FL=1